MWPVTKRAKSPLQDSASDTVIVVREQSGGFGLKDIPTFFVALLAFIVSFLTLYLTQLRAANISLSGTSLENQTDARIDPNWRYGVWPPNFEVFFKLYVSNRGSRIGSFEGLRATIDCSFKTFALEPSNQIFSTETENGNYKLLSRGERVIVKDREIIPIMLKMTFSPSVSETEQSQDNFKQMWAELLDQEPQASLQISYQTLEVDWRGRERRQIKGPLVINRILQYAIGVFAGPLSNVATGSSSGAYYQVAQECLEELRQHRAE